MIDTKNFYCISTLQYSLTSRKNYTAVTYDFYKHAVFRKVQVTDSFLVCSRFRGYFNLTVTDKRLLGNIEVLQGSVEVFLDEVSFGVLGKDCHMVACMKNGFTTHYTKAVVTAY